MRAIELFCGIGGFAAAARERVQIVSALDVSPHVLHEYARHFGDHARQVNLETVHERVITGAEASMWWLSPPCQPYTVRGHQRDLEDHRARSLIRLVDMMRSARPAMIGMENVAGFLDSEARALITRTLDELGYDWHERVLCPTELGVPRAAASATTSSPPQAACARHLSSHFGRAPSA